MNSLGLKTIKRERRFLIFAFYFSLCPCIKSASAQSWVIDYIGVREGLASPDIQSIFQDPSGLLWVGTNVGISHFDGTTFKNYSHSHDGRSVGSVKGIAVSNDTTLWLGSDRGLFYWQKGILNRCEFVDLKINTLCYDKLGVLWLGCENGLFYITSTGLDSILQRHEILPLKVHDPEMVLDSDNRITDLAVMPNGDLLITTFYVVCKFDGIDLTRIWGTPIVKPDIKSIHVVNDDFFFWTCEKDNFYQYDHGKITEVIEPDYLAADILYHEGDLWLLAVDALLLSRNQKIETIPLGQDATEWFREIILDREGNIWVTSFEGLIKIKESKFELYTDPQRDYPTEVYGIGANHKQQTWIGGNRGRIWQVSEDAPYLPSAMDIKVVPLAEVFTIYPDQNKSTWIGTGYQGIAKYENDGWQNFTVHESLSDNSRFLFFKDHQNRLWTIGDKGLDQLIRKENGEIDFKSYSYFLDDFSYVSFYGVVEDPNGGFWLGGTQGLFFFDHTEIMPARILDFEPTGTSITAMAVDKFGNIWLTTKGEGLLQCYFNEDHRIALRHQFNEFEDLNTDAFLALLVDQDDNIWIGSYQSLCVLSFTKGMGVPSIRCYDSHDGFITKSFGNMCLYQDKRGIIWGGTSQGLFSVNPKLITKNEIPPVVILKAVQVQDIQYEWPQHSDHGTGLFELDLNPEFPRQRNSIEFDFTSTSLAKPQGISYRYRLRGLEDEWTPTKDRNITYSHLLPGSYQFEVLGRNEDGVWSEEPLVYSFRIKPAFWSSWWFKLSMTLVLGMAIYKFILYRKKQNNALANQQIVEYFANSNYANSSVEEILWDLARNVVSRLNFEDCVVYQTDSKNRVLNQVAAFGAKNPIDRVISNPIQIQFGKGIVGSAAESRRTILVDDTSKDSRYIIDLKQNGSELAVPIIHEGKVLGVIDSENTRKKFFQKMHVDVLEKISEHCAHKIASGLAHQAIADSERELLNVQKEIAESRLTALQAQMNPHFIFNSLNSINWYIVKNRPQEASHYLTKFSKLVRLILDNSKKNFISLETELDTLKLYLALEAMRFEDRFIYHIQTDRTLDLEEVSIPPLILQPFVENALWHGLMHKEGQGEILIQIYPHDGTLHCVVQDNGIGRKAAAALKSRDHKAHQSKGLKLTSDRLKLLHKDFIREDMIRIIDLEDGDGQAAGTRVEVILPYV